VAAWDAIVLAGGAATRLGGGLKPAMIVGGVRMLDRVLTAVGGAHALVVVGPPELMLPSGVTRAQEKPPGGGPASGVAAAFRSAQVLDPAMATDALTGVGMSALAGDVDLVAIVAGDLPLLTPEAIDTLLAAVHDDGAIYVDDEDRPQWLCGVWRTEAIIGRINDLTAERGGLDGASLRALFGPLHVRRVQHHGEGPPPYLDCDTDGDIRRAEEWLAR
jgi:molybdopterin-guanine dinucleotide biosynthesis protein A